ncbi:Pyridoxal-phosphate-dependent serine hydroxymethyltransferase [Gossypium australe]|uniref:Pyridoxal-phosphate-dependent serine hydroxymethyltransferase n=1 Tax=Gossypium australe TaxID=47621 RepID=A0A5B6WS54_9ROSI|nr:Pyridoxal-phosphate-dependent serine hydroxymethyltransferase [Gossypium australe]
MGASYVEARRHEFMNLVQGERFVAECEAEFLRCMLKRWSQMSFINACSLRTDYDMTYARSDEPPKNKVSAASNVILRCANCGRRHSRNLELVCVVGRLSTEFETVLTVLIRCQLLHQLRPRVLFNLQERHEDRDDVDVITGSFDLILGMDWLIEHRVSLDCASKGYFENG